jgi:hypothetical protein
MKIKQGFISNSSSASFILRINHITMDEFIDEMLEEYGWEYKVDEDIKNEDPLEVCISKRKIAMEKILGLNTMKQYNELEIKPTESGDLVIKEDTTMYNSMTHGPSKLMQRIALLFCFKLRKYTTESEVEDTH